MSWMLDKKYDLKKALKTSAYKILIYDDGSGEIELYNHGSRHTVLSNILQISRHKGDLADFKKMLHDSQRVNAPGLEGEPISKQDIISAVKFSLEEDPSDGLYELLGGTERIDYGEDFYSERNEMEHEMDRCLRKNFIDGAIAKDVAEVAAEHAIRDMPSESDAFYKEIKNLTDSFDGKPWKQFIYGKIEKCSEEYNDQLSPFFRYNTSDAAGLIGCLIDEIQNYSEFAAEGLFETMMNEFHEHWNLDDKFLKELSEERGIPFEIMEHCSHGGYEVLEKYRPIKENQTFLESYGAKITEPSENKIK